MFVLAVQPPFPRASGRASRFSRLAGGRGAFYQRNQPRKRILPILFLASKLLSLDNDEAFARNALIFQRQQFFLIHFGQGRCPDIEAQMNGRRHLVNVLPARSLGTRGVEFHFGERKADLVRNFQHGISIVGRFLIHDLAQLGSRRQLPDAVDEKLASRLQLIDLFLLFAHDVIQCLNRIFLIGEFGFQVYQAFFDHASTFEMENAD